MTGNGVTEKWTGKVEKPASLWRPDRFIFLTRHHDLQCRHSTRQSQSGADIMTLS